MIRLSVCMSTGQNKVHLHSGQTMYSILNTLDLSCTVQNFIDCEWRWV